MGSVAEKWNLKMLQLKAKNAYFSTPNICYFYFKVIFCYQNVSVISISHFDFIITFSLIFKILVKQNSAIETPYPGEIYFPLRPHLKASLGTPRSNQRKPLMKNWLFLAF